MNKKIKKIMFVCFAAAAGVLYGCDGLLDTDPATSVDPDEVQESLEGMEGLATSIHSRMRAFARYGNALMLLPDVLADNTDRHPTTSGRYQNQSINAPGSHFGLWGSAYNVINEANFIIEGIDQVEAIPDADRSRLLGEAHFMRGFAYHDLVKIYGYEPGREVDGWDAGVIIRTEPTRDVTEADDRPRSTNREVYDLILEDLELAIDFLAQGDRGVYHANHEAALSLMARVHLFLENWQEAADYATQALETTSVTLVDEAAYAGNIFESEPNPESIYELSIHPDTETLGSSDALDQYINPSGWFDIIPSDNLLDLYDENDVRMELFSEHTDGFPYIQKFNGSGGTYTDNVPIIRYPELLFIRAEANAELGNEADAITDLETLRTARGLGTYSSPPSGENLILEILDERRRELAFEGHRWFDLKRRGMDISKQGGLPAISYQDHRLLSPIPSAEIEDFENVVQNPGY